VKPDYFTSGKQLRVSCEAAFLNICLWNYADDEGRLVDDAMEIAARCPRFFDVKGEKVERLLVELHASRLIHRYEHKQGKFIQCHDFENHQAIQKKKTSTIPTMSDGYCTDTVTLPERYCNATVGRKEGRKEGKEGKERKGKEKTLSGDARLIITFLNEKTGKNYQPVKANLDLIQARLKEGFSVKQLKQVVAKKVREWKCNEKMAEYLRPKTLFNRTNFANYAGELGTKGPDDLS